MSKKHFIALARALHKQEPGAGTLDASDLRWFAWYKACEAVADVCGYYNDDFDRKRFLTACGVKD